MEGAGVEGYRPEDWGQEETRKLDELVNQLGETNKTITSECQASRQPHQVTTLVCVWRWLVFMLTWLIVRGVNTEAYGCLLRAFARMATIIARVHPRYVWGFDLLRHAVA